MGIFIAISLSHDGGLLHFRERVEFGFDLGGTVGAVDTGKGVAVGGHKNRLLDNYV